MNRAAAAATAIALAGGALIAPATAANADWGQAPPPGTTYWVDDRYAENLIVIKRAGNRIRMGTPLAPCYTGIRQSSGSYSGGGFNQAGGYTWQRVRFNFVPGKRALKYIQSELGKSRDWYSRYTRKQALALANPRPPSIRSLFSDCELR